MKAIFLEDLKKQIEDGKNLCKIGESASQFPECPAKDLLTQFEMIRCTFDALGGSLDNLEEELKKN